MIYDTIWFFEKIELDSIGIHICQGYVPVFDNCPTINYLFLGGHKSWLSHYPKMPNMGIMFVQNFCTYFLIRFF